MDDKYRDSQARLGFGASVYPGAIPYTGGRAVGIILILPEGVPSADPPLLWLGISHAPISPVSNRSSTSASQRSGPGVSCVVVSSTSTRTPPSSRMISLLPRRPRLIPLSARLSRARCKSSARVTEFGASSVMGSQPSGGEPGGEMRKFLSDSGGARWNEAGSGFIGVKGSEYSRRMILGISGLVRTLLVSRRVWKTYPFFG